MPAQGLPQCRTSAHVFPHDLASFRDISDRGRFEEKGCKRFNSFFSSCGIRFIVPQLVYQRKEKVAKASPMEFRVKISLTFLLGNESAFAVEPEG